MKYLLWSLLSALTAFWAWARHKDTIIPASKNLRDHANAIISSMENIGDWSIHERSICHRKGMQIKIGGGIRGINIDDAKDVFNSVEKEAIWVAYKRLVRNTIVSDMQPKQLR